MGPAARFERRQFLDRSKNPWFDTPRRSTSSASATAGVGRISAHIDQRWDEFQGGNDGMFGFFESDDDLAVVDALIGAAPWLRERGRARMLGPMDFTINDECGLLIEGYEIRR